MSHHEENFFNYFPFLDYMNNPANSNSLNHDHRNNNSAITSDLNSYLDSICISSVPAGPRVVNPVEYCPTKEPTLETDRRDFQNLDDWTMKPIKCWKSVDILQWLNHEARMMGICCTELPGEKLAIFDGNKLANLTQADFICIDEKHGLSLYSKLHEHKAREMLGAYDNNFTTLESRGERSQGNASYNDTPVKSEPSFCGSSEEEEEEEEEYSDDENSSQSSGQESHQPNADNETKTEPVLKKRPGRPKLPPSCRKKKREKVGRLWEFIRDLLKNKEYCPKLIAWDDYDQAMFRFVHSDKIAKLWGVKKGNPNMNYEKLSRAMRYYYKSKVLQAVPGRRLVYKFGPNATGWRVDNPNFQNP